MIRLEFKWWAWLVALLVVFMIWKGPGTMEWFGGTLLHGFADTGDTLVRALHAVQICPHSPCR
jgi:hypothetical protein